MKQIHTRGIMLRRTNYQEADRILTIMSEQYGKISAIAKGARRSKSKLAGGIELFAVNDLTLIQGKSDLHTLTSSRVKTQFGAIVKDIDRTMKAYEYIKTVDKIVSEAEGNVFFEVLCKGLEGLNEMQLDHNLVDVWFYLHILNESGVLPNLRQDTDGDVLEESLAYDFNVGDMQFNKAEKGSFTSAHIKLLRVALTHSSAKKLSNIYVDEVISTLCSSTCKHMVEHNLL